jgi:hypothetical protein
MQKRQPWKTKEKQDVLRFFKHNIEEKQFPKKDECDRFLELHQEMKDRSWRNVKDFVRNHIVNLTKQK